MSRAFVKEDNAGEPPLIPLRAALPPGMPNYVTPQGLAQLRAELTELEAERARAEANHDDESNRTRTLTILNGQLSALMARIASAKVVPPPTEPVNQVRFGATVVLRTHPIGKPPADRKFTIVGVDEASVPNGKVAFVAPIARTITGAKLGQKLTLRLGPTEETVEVTEIYYE